ELQIPRSALALAGFAGDAVSALTGWHSLANRHKTRLARPRWWLCDASRARAELGWAPRTTLQQGVRETYLWYLQAGWMRARTPRPSHHRRLARSRRAGSLLARGAARELARAR